jgi:PTH1 family peptidyl-tRNA hydrolase
MWLIVGLGNPGREYEGNRHNVGFMVVDELARRAGLSAGWRAKFGGELSQGRLGEQSVALLKPMKYMNLSGEVVQPAAAFLKLEPAQVLVAHDELDLDFGRLQVKVGGGTAGHNGLKSIAGRLATPEFVRIRIGIGRPDPRMDGADYVLSNFSKVEQKELPFQVADAADAIELIVQDGVVAAMNRFNRKKDSLPPR